MLLWSILQYFFIISHTSSSFSSASRVSVRCSCSLYSLSNNWQTAPWLGFHSSLFLVAHPLCDLLRPAPDSRISAAAASKASSESVVVYIGHGYVSDHNICMSNQASRWMFPLYSTNHGVVQVMKKKHLLWKALRISRSWIGNHGKLLHVML